MDVSWQEYLSNIVSFKLDVKILVRMLSVLDTSCVSKNRSEGYDN